MSKLHFKVGLSGSFWDKRPEWRILIDNTEVKTGVIDGLGVSTVEFDHDIEDGAHSFKVELLNKTESDTVKDEAGGIKHDMLLHISSLEIDEVYVGELLWSNSTFTGFDSDRPVLTRCVDLGWNGTWEFPFSEPFYLWMLEKM